MIAEFRQAEEMKFSQPLIEICKDFGMTSSTSYPIEKMAFIVWFITYIKPEAARRTAKDQSDHNKERHKCGCDKEPLTLSIQPPGLPIIYEPKM